jgi:hypothetical protein
MSRALRRQLEALLEEPVKLPTNTWEVEFEVRRQGSIGEFEWFKKRVRAEEHKVLEWALEDIHDMGWEARGHRNMRRLA